MPVFYKVMAMRHQTSLPTTTEIVTGTGGRSWDGSYDEPSRRAIPMDPMTLATFVKMFTDPELAMKHETELRAAELARSKQSSTRVSVTYFTMLELVE